MIVYFDDIREDIGIITIMKIISLCHGLNFSGMSLNIMEQTAIAIIVKMLKFILSDLLRNIKYPDINPKNKKYTVWGI